MLINVINDDKLMQAAQKATGAKTKKATRKGTGTAWKTSLGRRFRKNAEELGDLNKQYNNYH